MDFPYLTSTLAGIPLHYKEQLEDFVVEELPAYAPNGAGTHVFFEIEKRGLTTHQAIALCARALGRAPRDFGCAGLKDLRGITRQMLSIEHADPDRVRGIEARGLRVLSVARHGNKLKLGHLHGNRFAIRLRGAACERESDVRALLDELARRGVPNYFGEQRFGARGETWEIGRALLEADFERAVALLGGDPRPIDRGALLAGRTLFAKGDFEAAASAYPGSMRDMIRLARALARRPGNARQALHVIDRTLLRFYVSAWQSWIFNAVVAQRVDALDRVLVGDLAWKHENGAVFRVEELEREAPRALALEISASGPLFGARMTEPAGEAAQLEQAALAQFGADRASFDRKGPWQPAGGRRPLRFSVHSPALEGGSDANGRFIELRFTLDPGSYATSVLREIVKDARDPSADSN